MKALSTKSRLYLSFVCLATLCSPLAVPPAHAADKKPSATESSKKPTKPTFSPEAQRSLELNEQGVAAIKARNFDQAESLFKRALETDSRNITAVFNLAGMYITNKKESQAISLLTKYAEEFPKDAGLHARLGDAYFSSQNPKAAIASYEKALALDPSYASLPVKLGTLYVLQNNLPKAASMYERAVKANPRDSQSLQNLSSIYLGLGKPQMAVTTAKKALQVASTPEAYVALGNAYQEMKDDKNALIAFQRAKDLGFKDPELTKVIESLRSKGAKETT